MGKMKSSSLELKKRGMIEQTDVDKLIDLSYQELLDPINAASPTHKS